MRVALFLILADFLCSLAAAVWNDARHLNNANMTPPRPIQYKQDRVVPSQGDR